MKSIRHKHLILICLYIAQSVPMSFFTSVVPVIMRQEDYSLELIGLVQLIKLPWAIKFLWAPLVDSTGGSIAGYRRIIFRSELVFAGLILMMLFFNLHNNLIILLVLMLLAITASATQDIATDAFAIKVLPLRERGPGNSMQSAGGFIGALIGSGLLLIIFDYAGWPPLIIGLALFVLAALIPLYLFKPSEPRPDKKKGSVIKIADLYLFFSQPGSIKRVMLLLLYYSGVIGIMAMVKPWLIDLGLSVKQIGSISGIFGTGAGAIFAFVGGYIIKRFGRKYALVLFAIINSITAISFFIISLGSVSIAWIYLLTAMLWGSYSMSTVIIFTISMDMVRGGREGTDFTIQIVITHIGALIMSVLSGKIAGVFSYSHLFFLSFILSLVNICSTFLLYSNSDLCRVKK